MRYQPLPASFHAANRRRLAESIGLEAVAIIDTAAEIVRNGDSNYPFRPDSNFYYLTGIDQPDAVLVLIPGATDPKAREMLFLRETSEFIATWEGQRFNLDEASVLSGVPTVRWTKEIDGFIKQLLDSHEYIFTNAPTISAAGQISPAAQRLKKLKRHRKKHIFSSVEPYLVTQRMIKDPVEIKQIKHAISITKQGLDQARASWKNGIFEYAVEAEITQAFVAAGASGHAYEPIVASGSNATVLHYGKNDQRLRDGELVLIDVGAEYGWYAADITRTYPVGKSTPRARQVYAAVLEVQQAAIKLLKPGTVWRDYERAVRQLIGEQLIKLGKLKPEDLAGEDGWRATIPFYPHSTSHFLGLDVHDVGDHDVPLAPAMVITCEPGLYLKDEGIGVRLEDDILITATGNENLSADIPILPDEI